jgi:hypothetical protein
MLIYIAPVIATVLFWSFFYRRERLLGAGGLILIALAINAYPIAWFLDINYSKTVIMTGKSTFLPSNINNFFPLLGSFTGLLFTYSMPWFLLLGAALLSLHRDRHNVRSANLAAFQSEYHVYLLIYLVISLLVLAWFCPFDFYRYLAPAAVIGSIFTGLMFAYIFRNSKIAGFLLAVIFLFFVKMPDYLYELTHDYDGPEEGICRYLNANAKKGHIVVSSYGEMAIKFYTNLRVLGGLTGEDLSEAKDADWVIIRKYSLTGQPAANKEWLLKNIRWEKYRKITLPYPELWFENREDPRAHIFRTQTAEPRVVIYRKI